uniref:Granulins domain-containing protein n=1 Tax=Sinocyclocheilus anshuiensis TaxID=1608454 RepID=A0A671SCK2_9TELE
TNMKKNCDVTRVSCIRGDVVIPWYNNISVQSTPAPSLDLGTVECDEQSSCSADSTCCHLSTGEWGCCPLPEAVCCPDQEHCCPKGYRCDLRRRSCIKTTWLHVEIVPLAHIDDQKPQSSISEKDIQCGGGYSCKDSETCCPTSQTTWGCCPSPKAVCCTDGEHCCPANYECDVTRVSCIRGDVVIPWYNNISVQSTPAPSLDLGDILVLYFFVHTIKTIGV